MSPDHGSSRRRGVWSHWVPLAVTLTVATVGVAAWVWSQRKDEDEDEHLAGLDYDNQAYGGGNQARRSGDFGRGDTRGPEKPPRPEEQTHGIRQVDEEATSSGGWRQFIDSTAPATAPSPLVGGKRRKTVAIVVSADTQIGPEDDDPFHEHASILSHIPRHNDFSKVKVFVLIYAPGLKDTAVDTATSNLPPASLSSSFSNIGHDQAQTPGEEVKNPMSSGSPGFNSVYSQALALVEKETMVLPFTTPNGHVHILRHLQPEVIYLQKALSGEDGSTITTLQTWLRHDVILVVGADGGSGGLADSESEAERAGKSQEWWQRPERVGRGRGVVVVDSTRLNDDWARRVQGQE
ncbi:hypothetical protein CDV36_009291 [Fusarium kuroshium]|uniref:Peroxin 22-like protein n=1 Tax=Fusarium kuroshium TaxID=2010991 RepID=A0A3M2S0R5_9HYPO|nr:hypothetical protein CDV36_009291 [Fusarium kuroshium]RSL67801.1 hypothetical protein CEP53_002866 [Fusarium sp. AF-6]